MTRLHAVLHPFRLALKAPIAAGGASISGAPLQPPVGPPLKAPIVTGRASIRFRAGFLVALRADGVTGWGEASPLPGWSRTSLLETEAALRRFSDGLADGGEAALGALLAAMRDKPHARAGAAGAWADLQARREGRPLAEQLVADRAGTVASEVAVNALIATPEPSEVEQAAREAVLAGFPAAKLKVGAADPEVDVARIRAARAGLGPAAELRLDANGAWDEHTALDVLDRVHDCRIAYCEEPVAGIAAIAAVGRRSPIPVAVDESIRSESDVVRAMDAGVTVLIVKPQALGGPDVGLSVSRRALHAGASVTVTSFLDSAVGVVHALHLAAVVDAASSKQGRAHGLATPGLLAEDVAEAVPAVAGAMALPAAPGLGLVPGVSAGP